MWKRLLVDDLKKILSDDEIEKLEEISTTSPDVAQQVLDLIADAWRGAWDAKGYEVDVRDHYVAPEYIYYILVHARSAIWTRFPNSPAYALDEARKGEYEKALELLKNPYLGTSKPDYSDDPEIAPKPTQDAAIAMPYLRFPNENGFISGDKQIWAL